jgi:putative transcriptional regulator
MTEITKYNNLKEILTSKGVKASFIAKSLGVNKNTVYNWLSQKSQPSLKTLNDVAEILNVDVKDLLTSSRYRLKGRH